MIAARTGLCLALSAGPLVAVVAPLDAQRLPYEQGDRVRIAHRDSAAEDGSLEMRYPHRVRRYRAHLGDGDLTIYFPGARPLRWVRVVP